VTSPSPMLPEREQFHRHLFLVPPFPILKATAALNSLQSFLPFVPCPPELWSTGHSKKGFLSPETPVDENQVPSLSFLPSSSDGVKEILSHISAPFLRISQGNPCPPLPDPRCQFLVWDTRQAPIYRLRASVPPPPRLNIKPALGMRILALVRPPSAARFIYQFPAPSTPLSRFTFQFPYPRVLPHLIAFYGNLVLSVSQGKSFLGPWSVEPYLAVPPCFTPPLFC